MRQEFPGRVPFTIEELQGSKEYLDDLHRAWMYGQSLEEIAERHEVSVEQARIDTDRLGETLGKMPIDEVREFLDLERYDLDTAHRLHRMDSE